MDQKPTSFSSTPIYFECVQLLSSIHRLIQSQLWNCSITRPPRLIRSRFFLSEAFSLPEEHKFDFRAILNSSPRRDKEKYILLRSFFLPRCFVRTHDKRFDIQETLVGTQNHQGAKTRLDKASKKCASLCQERMKGVFSVIAANVQNSSIPIVMMGVRIK